MEQTQPVVDNYFASATSYWGRIYSEDDLIARIYQNRQQMALEWVRQLRLSAGAHIADVGCGVGGTAVLLAQLGYNVAAIDRVSAMLALVEENANRAQVSSRITTMLCDAGELHLPNAAFDITIALGLLPWISRPKAVLAELARV